MSALEHEMKLQAKATQIIEGFLKELLPDMRLEYREHNAAAIIARLAQNDPPILLGYMEDFKE